MKAWKKSSTINQSTFKFSALVVSLQAQVGALLSFFWALLPDAMGLALPIQTKMTYTTKQNTHLNDRRYIYVVI